MEPEEIIRRFNPLSPTTRQTTRAIQEIQAQRRNSPNGVLDEMPLNPNNLLNSPDPQFVLHMADRLAWTASQLNESLTTPTPSPDEMVIQARGRRQVPLTFSPDINHTPLRQQMQRAKMSSLARSPTRGCYHSRLLLPSSQLRTSPRKKLTLNDTPPGLAPTTVPQVYTPSPDKAVRTSPLAKKIRLDRVGGGGSGGGFARQSPEVAIKGLSQAQLADLLGAVILGHPELRDEIGQMVPPPDLKPIEESLSYLKKNIYKALPNTRLESKTDSMAYNRVSVHLMSFKKTLVDSLRRLLDSQQWLSVIDFTIMAWDYVKATPVWDNLPHNNIRKSCLKALATGCMQAIKRGNFGCQESVGIKSKLEKLKTDSEEIAACLKHLELVINNGNVES